MILILNYQLIDGIFDGIIMCIARGVYSFYSLVYTQNPRQINCCKFWVMYPCQASRLSVTICPIKMPLFKMRCFMPESYNVLKICLEVIVAIDDYSQLCFHFD